MKFRIFLIICLYFLSSSGTLFAQDPVKSEYKPVLRKEDLPDGYKSRRSSGLNNLYLPKYILNKKASNNLSEKKARKEIESWATMSIREGEKVKKKTGKWPLMEGITVTRYYFASQSDALAFWKYYLYPLFCNRPAKFPVPIREGSFSGNYLGDYCWVKEAPSDQVREEWEEISPGYFRNHRTIIFIKGNVLVRIDASRTPHNASGEVDPLFAEKIARIVESRL